MQQKSNGKQQIQKWQISVKHDIATISRKIVTWTNTHEPWEVPRKVLSMRKTWTIGGIVDLCLMQVNVQWKEGQNCMQH